MVQFRELAEDFYYDTSADGYEALYELVQRFGPDSKKGKIVQELIQEIGVQSESIKF